MKNIDADAILSWISAKEIALGSCRSYINDDVMNGALVALRSVTELIRDLRDETD